MTTFRERARILYPMHERASQAKKNGSFSVEMGRCAFLDVAGVSMNSPLDTTF
ncbi:MAG: hypothetical protein WAT81_05675 [Candidatus Moraniibacteriota bacterium]